jgi:hypothetical protein
MITDFDKIINENIDFEKFLDMMTARMSDKDTREDISKVLRLFYDDTSGSITLKIFIEKQKN